MLLGLDAATFRNKRGSVWLWFKGKAVEPVCKSQRSPQVLWGIKHFFTDSQATRTEKSTTQQSPGSKNCFYPFQFLKTVILWIILVLKPIVPWKNTVMLDKKKLHCWKKTRPLCAYQVSVLFLPACHVGLKGSVRVAFTQKAIKCSTTLSLIHTKSNL